MIRYKPHQTAKMIVDPYHEDQNIFEAYPQLREVVEPFSESLPDVNYHQYFRYLSFCYDPNSPLAKEIQDIQKRKEAAKAEVGYEGAEHHQIAVEFIKTVVRSRIWTLICNMDFVFDEYTDKLNELIKGSDPEKSLKAVELKNKMLDQQASMVDKREELYNRLFDDDKELVEVAQLTFNPESVANFSKKRA